MEAIDKAKELVDKFYDINDDKQSTLGTSPYISRLYSKQCALICVDETFEAMSNPISFKYKFTKRQKKDWEVHRTKLNNYWNEVKQEIINL